MKKSLLLTTSLGMAVMFSGCATILDGKTQKISVNSNPSGIGFNLDGKNYSTPAIISVKRENKDKLLKIENKKCQRTILLNKKVNPTFFVNILSGGAFGSTTDYATGAMWKYDDNVNINCK